MWNVIVGNRLIDRKRKAEAQKRHVKALDNIRSLIDNSTPNEYSFLNSRPKAHQLKQGTPHHTQNASTTSRARTASSLIE